MNCLPEPKVLEQEEKAEERGFQPPKPTLTPPKPFFGYEDLVERLQSRGMLVECPEETRKKLEQIGYYRLSGYWYPARILDGKVRSEQLWAGTQFNDVVKLYVFDKRLRMLLGDALERVEIYIRSVVAHELGKLHPLAYRNEKTFLKNSLKKARGKSVTPYEHWVKRLDKLVRDSLEESIVWHKQNGKEMPFWVVIEAWDFGQLQHFYKNLSDKNKQTICDRLNISDTRVLESWLKALNILRNRCAHHNRTWNRSTPSIRIDKESEYFSQLNLSDHSRRRVFGLIAVLWLFIREINPDSRWLENMSDLIDKMPRVPGCSLAAMGVPEDGLPIDVMF